MRARAFGGLFGKGKGGEASEPAVRLEAYDGDDEPGDWPFQVQPRLLLSRFCRDTCRDAACERPRATLGNHPILEHLGVSSLRKLAGPHHHHPPPRCTCV